jgi:hypothetical protein
VELFYNTWILNSERGVSRTFVATNYEIDLDDV